MLASALDLAAARRGHHLHELLGNLRLEPFGVPLVEPDDIGDEAAIAAIAERSDFRLPRPGQEAPRLVAGILSRAVVYIAGLRVDDLAPRHLARAAVLLRALRCRRQRADLVLAGFEDVREVAHRRRGNRERSWRKRRWCCRAAAGWRTRSRGHGKTGGSSS